MTTLTELAEIRAEAFAEVGDEAIWTHNGAGSLVRGFYQPEHASDVDARAKPFRALFKGASADFPGVAVGDGLLVNGVNHRVVSPILPDRVRGEITLRLVETAGSPPPSEIIESGGGANSSGDAPISGGGA